MLSKKDFEEIRTIARQSSKGSLSKQGEETAKVEGNIDTKSITSGLLSQHTETTNRSHATKFSDNSSLYSEALSKTTVNRLEE
jgi:hypothetical protein